MRNAFLHNVRGKLVLAQHNHVALDVLRKTFSVIRRPVLNNMLNNIVSVLILYECRGKRMKLLQQRPLQKTKSRMEKKEG
jgi:hypothetical protein